MPPDVAIELVNLRSTGESPPRQPFRPADVDAALQPEPRARRSVYFQENRGFVDTPIYHREQLSPGFEARGPLLIEESSTTVVVGPSATVRMSFNTNLVIAIEEMSA